MTPVSVTLPAAANGQPLVQLQIGESFDRFGEIVLARPLTGEPRAGSSRPVRFSLAGFRGPGVLAPDSPTSQQVDCPSGAPLGPPTPTPSSGSSASRKPRPVPRAGTLERGCARRMCAGRGG